MVNCMTQGLIPLPFLSFLTLFGMSSYEFCQMHAQDMNLPVARRMRSITEPSAVERYRADRVSVADPKREDLRTLSQPYLGRTPVTTESAAKVESVGGTKLVQFQFPTPGSSSAAGGDFLNPTADNPQPETPDTGALAPFSQPGQSQPLDSSVGGDLSNSGGNRELPRVFGSEPVAKSPENKDSGEYAPFSSIDLGEQYATVNNSTFVAPPSGYIATTSWGKNAVNPKPYSSIASIPSQKNSVQPAQSSSPNGLVRIADSNTLGRYPAVPTRPLLSFGQELNCVVVGQGVLGQPVAYVPGQWIRNSVRYLLP